MKVNNAVLVGLFAASSIILGIMENFIPMPVPAIRLGLSNLPIMIMLYLANVRMAFSVMLLKSFLVPIFAGNFLFKLSLGLPSTVAAFIVMLLIFKLLKDRTTALSLGVAGAFTHMFVQLSVASTLYINGLIYTKIAGILLLISIASGVLTGILTDKLVNNKSVKILFDIKN